MIIPQLLDLSTTVSKLLIYFNINHVNDAPARGTLRPHSPSRQCSTLPSPLFDLDGHPAGGPLNAPSGQANRKWAFRSRSIVTITDDCRNDGVRRDARASRQPARSTPLMSRVTLTYSSNRITKLITFHCEFSSQFSPAF